MYIKSKGKVFSEKWRFGRLKVVLNVENRRC